MCQNMCYTQYIKFFFKLNHFLPQNVEHKTGKCICVSNELSNDPAILGGYDGWMDERAQLHFFTSKCPIDMGTNTAIR